ncbi:MAG: hypothetical protein UH239_03850 [Acutalibacteraceae bacterium]|nr:hypothetical protein [Acutalibacteraceae bacterium]
MKKYVSPFAEIITIANTDAIVISGAVGEAPGADVGGGSGDGSGFFD